MNNGDTLRCYDVCCGAGALSDGFRRAGAVVLGGIDIDAPALETARANHPDAKWERVSIEQLAAEVRNQHRHPIWKANTLLAGLPCQGFSCAGRRDPTDPRNGLYKHLLSLAKTVRPRFIVMENVVGMTASRNGEILPDLCARLRRIGYGITSRILDAADYRVPQHRKRLFLVGVLGGDGELVFEGLKVSATKTTVRNAFRGIAGTRENKSFSHTFMAHTPAVEKKLASLRPGGPISYRRLIWNRPAPTLVAGHRALPVHPKYPRAISAREAARLQGFSDQYTFAGSNSAQIEQIANAVPPPLATAVAKAVQKYSFQEKRVHGSLYGKLRSLADSNLRRRFTRIFLSVFASGVRQFPWRNTRDPFVTLITEILLQRTNAELAVRVWRDVIRLVRSPAAAQRVDLRTLRPLIKKIGIPNRAMRIRQVGETVRVRHQGRVPQSFDDLLRLPGVGIYIASAVRVFSYAKRDFPVDSNAFRFVSRYFGLTLHGRKSEGRQLREFMSSLVPVDRPRDYVYGFLDFAATVCRPREPKCDQCPLRQSCRNT
ncbi:MAG: DNA (cytosine-5-)-methyltransferase [Planctomycetes bacterium]|nr:DNA (cytosine-5-)-methyltransferase [Planctomycetota bacterium]